MRKYLATVALLASVSNAYAGFWDGNFVHSQCKQNNMTFVHGYIAGWIDKWETDKGAVEATFERKGETPADLVAPKAILGVFISRDFCLPDNASAGQIADVFCKYLQENPARRAESSESLLARALEDAWPCRSK
ncbi:Rap1a/Tai family immunity protein [Rhizobium sp. BE258]|uniref:Rap1a/Tai family immunity protein n=1 Tax=Rhizobium sp. BE258 TaxID=2817722 RepID=UPI0028550503|nr:Rap1a/Tai family immunity protein [Rhizobium sp. BE258]MDR7145169.1 hypothetical protein [Rhizobium sp. BE258]